VDIPEPPLRPRRIFGNRTLNLRSIDSIGYDMDYTLIHYHVAEWEHQAFEHTRARLADAGWPVDDLHFDPDAVIRGLTLDLELGNLVKPTRFGYVIKASHGTRRLGFDELRSAYAGTFVDLADDRWVFLNTLFSLSEASVFAQLVDLVDAGRAPRAIGYADVYEAVRQSLDAAHMEGQLKADILADPERFVDLDGDIPLTLRDQQEAGKRLLLITNSDWSYTRRIMSYAFDRFMPAGSTWRDLFSVVIVSADKPAFFTSTRPMYRIVDEEAGHLEPLIGSIETGGAYVGGCAPQIESSFGMAGDEILYVGDHLFADVSVSKSVLRWRTALILRELESEIEASDAFAGDELRLAHLMEQKTDLERSLAAARLDRLRTRTGHAPTPGATDDAVIGRLRAAIAAIDDDIGPLAQASGRLRNATWGPLMRSGNDKSLFARQVERYADVYTSRVSNFLEATPYGYLRAARGTLPHDD
jgi:HAD superfamily 5'-nucleotidase-like hydrolase